MNIYKYFPKGKHKDVFDLSEKSNIVTISGLANASAKSYLISDFLNHFKKYKNIFWVVNTNKDIYEISNNLPFWLDLPIVSLDALHDDKENLHRATELVINLNKKESKICLLSHKDVSLKIPSYKEISEQGVVIKKDQEIMVVEFFNKLIQMGYSPSADVILKKGEYKRYGGVVNVFPPNSETVIKIEVEYDKITGIWNYDQNKKQLKEELLLIDFLPINIDEIGDKTILDHIKDDDLVIIDDIDDDINDFYKKINDVDVKKVVFTSFPQSDEKYIHLRYLSVLKYYNVFDLLNDLKDKIQRSWKINILTKRVTELSNIFNEENISYSLNKKSVNIKVTIIDSEELENIPESFQNTESKIQLLTDKEIFNLKKDKKNKNISTINLDFLTGLRVGDLVVHLDYGIGRFLGVDTKAIDSVNREYLEIAYAENDRLFIPVDQADKISKYVGKEESEPKLTRLGSQEWKTVSQKIKKETKEMAKELLKTFAKRASLKGFNYGPDTEDQKKLEKLFPYEETPGQMSAIKDVKNDMESDKPMDRLVCGDVGFGKTEVAIRAAFKAVQSGRQVAFVTPITILTDQHYKTLLKRFKDFDVKVEMLSRFRSPKEQKLILEDLRKGKIDIIIGTHRLFQSDVKFLNLGLVIIDEEQRFGVKQKEVFKKIRNQIDILTLTATPIPRTLNLSLNKLRDISTITTPPPGRLPIITEVRRYGDNLIIEGIRNEVKRGGQVYFLHNRVQTIESIANKLKLMMPEVRFLVAHGQLSSQELEKRILAFKEGKYDVLVSSTIIENGIDLPNANTLIVDDAEHFGLSQLYQLRGRIGRGKVQAYAYFLYQARQLRLDAKKRLRAIVEASELGSGFQIAMRDLEIRGAGDILGISQHGTIKVVGANHFLRMLNKTIDEMRSGVYSDDKNVKADVVIELPIEAYIPDKYIPNTKDKINVYQKLSSVNSFELLEEFREDLIAEYGVLHKQVNNLFKILQIKILSKQVGIIGVKAINMGSAGKQISLHLSSELRAEHIINLLKHNSNWLVSGDKLKIDMKYLGFNWIEELQKNISYLQLKKDKKN